MLERLMERGKTSGREDDNKESIIKRFSESLSRSSSLGLGWGAIGRELELIAFSVFFFFVAPDRDFHRDFHACR